MAFKLAVMRRCWPRVLIGGKLLAAHKENKRGAKRKAIAKSLNAMLAERALRARLETQQDAGVGRLSARSTSSTLVSPARVVAHYLPGNQGPSEGWALPRLGRCHSQFLKLYTCLVA